MSVKNKEPSSEESIIGKKFNRLLVLQPSERKHYFLCECDCGSIKEIYQYSITSGKSKSCGCLSFELKHKHGLTKSRQYSIHKKMIDRCYNKNNVRHSHYGGRGIEMCEEWLNKANGFKNFYDWSINNGYDDNLTIDRIDNNGNYEPNNCRWADLYTQANNTSRNVRLTINGETMTHSEIIRRNDFHPNLLYSRCKRGIVDTDELLKRPNLKLHSTILLYLDGKLFGKFKTQKEAGDFLGVTNAYVNVCLNKSKLCRGYILKREDDVI